MKQYLELLQKILDGGNEKGDRTGIGHAEPVPAARCASTSPTAFPMLTTKRLHWPSIAHELLWFPPGDTNVRYLRGERRHHLGRVGRRAGRARAGLRPPVALVADARRRHRGPDRVAGERDPLQPRLAPARGERVERRRHRAHGAAVPPCPPCSVLRREGRLSCHLYQRSADVSRRAVQHRVVRAADAPARRRDGPEARRVLCTASATSTSTSITSRRRAAADASRGRCRSCRWRGARARSSTTASRTSCSRATTRTR